MIKAVVLCGGSGTRLWPSSRNAYPKQLLSLVSEHTLLQDTILRSKSISTEEPIVICHEDYRFIVAEQIQALGITSKVILEPVGKNTCPAVAISAMYAIAEGSDPILLIMPADHVIKDISKFEEALEAALPVAEQNYLVTFGVEPNKPETGYGYIQKAEAISAQAFRVGQFVEKPDLKTAEAYLESKEYFWNSGIFLFKASAFLAELKRLAPEIYQACEIAVSHVHQDMDFIRIKAEDFAACPSDSIDYAVMEKTDKAAVLPFKAEWSDVGSWTALWEVNEPDHDGNVLFGDVLAEQVSNSYLRAESRMLAAVGIKDHIIVETSDAVLVAHKDHAQSVKTLVERLRKQERPETHLHRRVFRPWGSYETIDESSNFKVKRITVKPGGCLSLQMHHYRSEHWIVVSGVASVTRGEEVFLLQENESTYIPVCVRHRLENAGLKNLELIEVQSGSYLGEDDIVRYEDIYGRTEEVTA